ncbi:MAG: glutathione S-transferase family protein [Pseudomonadota bacterium]
MTARLITLLPSTDVETTRWLLQQWQIAYTEEPHAPIFNMVALQQAGFVPHGNPGFLDGELRLTGLANIAKHFAPGSPTLYPEPDSPEFDRVAAEVKYYTVTMGNGVVYWCYWNFMQEEALVLPSFTTGIPDAEKAEIEADFPAYRAKIVAGIKLSDQKAADGLALVSAGLDKVEALLADGREFLDGKGLSALDIAFAASAAPIVLAPGYGAPLPALDALPATQRAVIEAHRARPAGQFILRLYANHRSTRGCG